MSRKHGSVGMSIHDEGINEPPCFEMAARDWVIAIEDHHARVIGQPLPIARQHLARKVGIAPGTLENIRRGRLKGLRHQVAERLQAFMIHHLKTEINKLTHELEIVLQSRKNNFGDEIIAAQAALDEARRLLAEALK